MNNENTICFDTQVVIVTGADSGPGHADAYLQGPLNDCFQLTKSEYERDGSHA